MKIQIININVEQKNETLKLRLYGLKLVFVKEVR
jgi:hypothetical protein